MPIRSSSQIVENLPQEIIDAIIKEHRGDTSTLAACSLVSKEWLVVARCHLFATIDVSATNFRAVQTFLLSFASAVKTIRFHVAENDAWISQFCSDVTPGSTVSALALYLYGVELGRDTRAALTETFSDLTECTIHTLIASRRTLVKDIQTCCTFEGLISLNLSGSYYGSYPVESTSKLPSNIRALKLDLPSNAMKRIMAWLLAHEVMPTLTTFHASNVDETSLPGVLLFTQLSASTLEDLHLGVQCHPRSVYTTFGSSFPMLKKFSCRVDGMEGTSFMGHVVASLSSPLLEEIALHIPKIFLGQRGWIGLQKALDDVHFGKVVIVLMTDDYHQSYETELRKAFPRTNNLRIIREEGQSQRSLEYGEGAFRRFKLIARRAS